MRRRRANLYCCVSDYEKRERAVVLRRLFSSSLALFLLASTLAACGAKPDPAAAREVRIYQVLPVAREKSKFVNGKGEGEAIALVNTGSQPRTITGWALQTESGKALLPKVTLEPGKVVYLADDAEYFKQYWNFVPQYEYGTDADGAVPDLKLPDQKAPMLKDEGDVVRLLDEKGGLVDILAFGNITNPPNPWTGPAVQLINSFPLTPGNQVITRMRAGGKFLLEPRAASFSGGTPSEPQRVYYAGQSDFPVKTVAGNVTLTAASAPDNAGTVMWQLIDGARRSIKLAGYQFNNKELAGKLTQAVGRGVKVQVAIERNPGGSDMYDSDKEAQELLHNGGVEILYYHKWDGDLSTRINPLHSKYGIFDDEAVFVTSGNYTGSMYNTLDPTCGNREWLAVFKGSADLVKLLREVWDFDLDSGHPEVRRYDSKLDAPLQPDTYDSGPCIRYTAVKPQPLTVTANASVTRILSPDNTLDRESGFLGQLRGARTELLINANYIYKWWGPASATQNLTQYPQPYLTEILAAARRGVTVKVLLDRRNLRLDSLRDNHEVVKYLNDLARTENLKLEARLVNMDGSGVGRTYHNKSFIVDDAVVVSSINGSENSFRYAREMAIKVAGAPAFTEYYRDLFMHDWNASASPNFPWNLMAVPRNAGTFIDWSPNAEYQVVKYEVHYKARTGDVWTRLAEVERPGYVDSHHQGIWGVVAVTKDGARSNYAEVERK